MTKMVYTVLKRPTSGFTGRTDISWGAECGRDAVRLGGYLITKRHHRGETKRYTAMVIRPNRGNTGQDTLIETLVGTEFETRATAAFAIWRKYYQGWRAQRADAKVDKEAIRELKRLARKDRKQERQTPEGRKAYRLELNRKARVRRANFTAEDRAKTAADRRSKIKNDNFIGTYTND